MRLSVPSGAKARETEGGSKSHAALTPETAPETPLLRVQVDAIEARPGPVHLNAWTVVLHPERCLRADLASLKRVVAALADARRTGDRSAAILEDDVAELLERLEKCGAKVRVVEVLP